MPKPKRKKLNKIVLTVRELVGTFQNLQMFIALPKPPKMAWNLSLCYAKEIEPAIKAFESNKTAILKKFGLDQEFEPKKENESEQGFSYRKIKRLDAISTANSEIAELGEQEIELNLEKINADEFINTLNADIKITTELIIPWLFE